MRARSFAAALAVVFMVGVGARDAHADPKGDVAAKIKAAMESYDSFDYDGAKKLLNQALAVAKKAKLDKDPIVAKAYQEAVQQFHRDGGFLTAASGALSELGAYKTAYSIQRFHDSQFIQNFLNGFTAPDERTEFYIRGLEAP